MNDYPSGKQPTIQLVAFCRDFVGNVVAVTHRVSPCSSVANCVTCLRTKPYSKRVPHLQPGGRNCTCVDLEATTLSLSLFSHHLSYNLTRQVGIETESAACYSSMRPDLGKIVAAYYRACICYCDPLRYLRPDGVHTKNKEHRCCY